MRNYDYNTEKRVFENNIYLQETSIGKSDMSMLLRHRGVFFFVRTNCWPEIHITGVIDVPPVKNMCRTNPAVLVWNPVCPVYIFYPCFFFLASFWKRKNLQLFSLSDVILPVRTLKHDTIKNCRPEAFVCMYKKWYRSYR